jgi:LL-diaminopimelate aminotransferase
MSEFTSMWGAKRLLELPANRFRELTRLKATLAKNSSDFIDLSEGIPDLPPHQRLLKFFVSNGCKTDVHGYTGMQGLYGLRTALFEYLRTEFAVQRGDIDLLPAAGSKELIAHLCHAVLNEGDIALIPEIHYPLYPIAAKFAGAEVVTYSLRSDANWTPNLCRLSEGVLAKTRIVFLNYPHNPTGGVVSQQELDEIVAFFQQRTILVCLDLAYSHIYYEGRIAPNALKNANSSAGIIELHTFSKSLGLPGWRVAFAVGDRSIVELLDHSKAVFSTGLFVLLQKSLRYGLVNFKEFTAGVRETYEKRVTSSINALMSTGIDVVKPGGTFFLWVKLPRPGTATEFVRSLLLDRKVLIMPGSAFGEVEDQYVRISLTAPNEILKEAMRRICLQIQELKP